MLRPMTPAPSPPAAPGHPYRTQAVGTVVICVLVGFVLYVMRGRGFWVGMLYAFAIGLPISTSISVLMHLAERLLRRLRPEDSREWIGWGWMLPCVLTGSLIGYSVGLLLGDWLTGQHSQQLWQQPSGAAALTAAFVLMISVLGTLYFFSHFTLQAVRLAQADAQRQAAEARLALLQSQLEPHMLFNTLAHLRVLIKLKPDEAQGMLDRLIDYLRATLQASRAIEHPLADEFERLSDYLALMQLRMGERLRVKLDLPAELAGIAIPPLLLQPLVENAIKHGLEPHVDGGELRVTAARQGGRLTLEVADSGAGLAHATDLPGTGFGLAQVRERLAQRYGDKACFDLRPQPGGGSVASIEIPA